MSKKVGSHQHHLIVVIIIVSRLDLMAFMSPRENYDRERERVCVCVSERVRESDTGRETCFEWIEKKKKKLQQGRV